MNIELRNLTDSEIDAVSGGYGKSHGNVTVGIQNFSVAQLGLAASQFQKIVAIQAVIS